MPPVLGRSGELSDTCVGQAGGGVHARAPRYATRPQLTSLFAPNPQLKPTSPRMRSSRLYLFIPPALLPLPRTPHTSSPHAHARSSSGAARCCQIHGGEAAVAVPRAAPAACGGDDSADEPEGPGAAAAGARRGGGARGPRGPCSPAPPTTSRGSGPGSSSSGRSRPSTASPPPAVSTPDRSR